MMRWTRTASALLGVLLVLLVALVVTPAQAAETLLANRDGWGLFGFFLLIYGVVCIGDAALCRRFGFAQPRWRDWLGPVCFIAALLLVSCYAQAAEVRIPDASVRYRLQLERAAGQQWGINAPVARVAAQIHQESSWNPAARSAYAQGLSQFTPSTAAWLPKICPSVGAPDPWDPGWSMRAAVCYDAWLFDRAQGATTCDRWAMTLSAYNGGETARDREIRMAYEARDDPTRWFGQVERHRSRSVAAWTENRAYVRRILLLLEPAYLAEGWPGARVCP